MIEIKKVSRDRNICLNNIILIYIFIHDEEKHNNIDVKHLPLLPNLFILIFILEIQKNGILFHVKGHYFFLNWPFYKSHQYYDAILLFLPIILINIAKFCFIFNSLVYGQCYNLLHVYSRNSSYSFIILENNLKLFVNMYNFPHFINT